MATPSPERAKVLVHHAIEVELEKIAKKFPGDFSSDHEAYAVVLEELDEVWEIVKMKPDLRDPYKLVDELVQVAANAVKWAIQVRQRPGAEGFYQ